MQITTLKIKPRKPQQRVIDAAIKEGLPAPIARQPFELQVPVYGVEDILTAVEQNQTKVLEYIASMLNRQVVDVVRAQLNDDEQFPPHQEVDVTNFDLEQLKLDKLSEATVRTSALDLEFTEEQFKEFAVDFVKTLLPKYSHIKDAESKLLNTANALINDFKDIRNEADKMEKVKGTLDNFMQSATDEIVDKYSDMYEYFVAVHDKRMKALARKNEKTDVFLD